MLSSCRLTRTSASSWVLEFGCSIVARIEFSGRSRLVADWGVRADQVIDYQSLVGDAVDNVPGIPKVGRKRPQSD